MSRTFNIQQSIPANTTVPDVIAAQGINAYFGKAANITLYANGNAAGLTLSMTSDDGTMGEQHIPSGSSVGVGSTQDKIKTNEDFITQVAIPSGAKLLLAVTNGTAAAVIFNALVVIT